MPHKALIHKMDEKFQKLYSFLSSERFFEVADSRKEVPFFISAYPPQAQTYVDRGIINLRNRLASDGTEVLLIDLYALTVEILERNDNLALLREKEAGMSKGRFLNGLRSLLDVEKTLVPALEDRVKGKQFKMVFLTGVGLVYPFLRTHNILNNLHRVFKKCPLIVFFPGKYQYTQPKGYTLNLFGLMPGDNYYRAFDLDEYAV